MKTKSIFNQAIVLGLAILYGLIFIPLSEGAGTVFAWCYLIIPPTIIGIITNIYIGRSSATFGFFFAALALCLGPNHFVPYYSSDVGWELPVAVYSVFVVTANIAGITFSMKFRSLTNASSEAHQKEERL